LALSDDEVLERATPEEISEALEEIPSEAFTRALSSGEDSRTHARAVRALVVEQLRENLVG
jgi:hypothetical protein